MNAFPYEVACPACGASAQDPCIDRRRRIDGSHPPARRPHYARVDAANRTETT